MKSQSGTSSRFLFLSSLHSRVNHSLLSRMSTHICPISLTHPCKSYLHQLLSQTRRINIHRVFRSIIAINLVPLKLQCCKFWAFEKICKLLYNGIPKLTKKPKTDKEPTNGSKMWNKKPIKNIQRAKAVFLVLHA